MPTLGPRVDWLWSPMPMGHALCPSIMGSKVWLPERPGALLYLLAREPFGVTSSDSPAAVGRVMDLSVFKARGYKGPSWWSQLSGSWRAPLSLLTGPPAVLRMEVQ